ncbi:hypothetical protein AL073_13410 [Loktanella sp. 1ANDIMAR09]|uniref:DUF2062 domain-containing protein n=1 Tax=Yoonia rosea TaxID=287098 RepID=A0A1R3XHQ3_9RHOB|nr:hypothetical protein AL073_13410 [Loktanella sp. 1ANDIMAR09]SIT90936.1 hypothetical protein SAMN05421665_3278 [Yoonia rosea]
MVFKRRDRRAIWQIVLDFFYPRGGWTRAFEYVKHRVRRLPDTPQKISRGIWAGVFVCFTPLFGLHFVFAAIIARAMRGNIFAALMATFFGNPLTFPPIGFLSISLGSWLLGLPPGRNDHLGQKFADASYDLWNNVIAVFTPDPINWRGLQVFYDDVFFPYLVGGILPGLITATIAYYLAVPVIGAYQTRRKKALLAKLDQLKKKTSPEQGSGQ